jgi:hypothetical protein
MVTTASDHQLSPEAEALLRCSTTSSSPADQQALFRVARLLVLQPAHEIRKASCLVLVSAKIVGDTLLGVKRHGTSEQCQEFLRAHAIPDRVSGYCRCVAANWARINVSDPTGRTLQEICGTLKQQILAADTQQAPWFIQLSAPQPANPQVGKASLRELSPWNDEDVDDLIDVMKAQAAMGRIP